MSAVDDLCQQLLKRFPGLEMEVEGNLCFIHAPSPGGFSVTLMPDEEGFVVGFGEGWHEHVESPEAALGLVTLGLTAQSRLKIFRRGRCEYKWSVEYLDDERWIDVGTVGLFLFPFWRAPRIEYRQNTLVPAPREPSENQ